MMQVTRAAFQAVASLNVQATDPKSHTLVKTLLQEIQRYRYLQIPMVDSLLFTPHCSSSDKMSTAVDVEQLAGHEVAFRR